jgi:hypothetical protein
VTLPIVCPELHRPPDGGSDELGPVRHPWLIRGLGRGIHVIASHKNPISSGPLSFALYACSRSSRHEHRRAAATSVNRDGNTPDPTIRVTITPGTRGSHLARRYGRGRLLIRQRLSSSQRDLDDFRFGHPRLSSLSTFHACILEARGPASMRRTSPPDSRNASGG